jgi:putative oxygen-independent coproporphyrinogen III oxidase
MRKPANLAKCRLSCAQTTWWHEPAIVTPSVEPLALYIHWPFCLSRCPYCDFNAHVRDVVPQQRFRNALRHELAWEAERVGRRSLRSIFFGGGTPSLMEPETVAALLEDARALFDCQNDPEITLEANPTSIETSRLAALRDAGVNRISIGIQSLEPEPLAMLGRQHSVAQAVAALEIAHRLFPRISFDLIYARPGQSVAAWRSELRRALDLVADHLSLYQLTIEPGTKFEALHRRGDIVLPDEDLAAALYDATAEEAARFGLLQYEISNYAKPGGESRHNLQYWRYGDYAGIGPGAHGRLTVDGRIVATRRHRAPEPWADLVERTGHGMTEQIEVSAEEAVREMLLMGLRLTEGVPSDRFLARTGRTLESAIDAGAFRQAAEAGYMTWHDGRLTATQEGRRRLDALLPYLLI